MYDWRNVIPEGCVWNEAQLDRDDPFNRVLLSLLVIRDDPDQPLQLDMVGTAFIIQANGTSAFAVSAAHCFERIREILHPHPLYHPSTLPEFLPTPSEIDLTKVKALYHNGNISIACNVGLATWDPDTDCALLFINSPPQQPLSFKESLSLDDQIPEIGDPVAMVGLGEMEFLPNIDPVNFGTIKRRVVMRVGRVENIHTDGYYRVKSPCVETSISTLPGMSGGIVARWTAPNSQVQPFGFISRGVSSGSDYYDRSIPGGSIGVILKLEKMLNQEGGRSVKIKLKAVGIGRDNLSFGKSYDQQQDSREMNSTKVVPLHLEQCLLCDDIRYENNGKAIIIGVYADLLVEALPTAVQVHLWMRFTEKGVGTHVIECSVLGERNQKLAQNMTNTVQITDSTVRDHLFRIMLYLTESGIAKFRWRDNGEEWRDALSVKIGVLPPPVRMFPAQPPGTEKG